MIHLCLSYNAVSSYVFPSIWVPSFSLTHSPSSTLINIESIWVDLCPGRSPKINVVVVLLSLLLLKIISSEFYESSALHLTYSASTGSSGPARRVSGEVVVGFSSVEFSTS